MHQNYEKAKKEKRLTLQNISSVSERLRKPEKEVKDLEQYWILPEKNYLEAKMAYLKNQLLIDDLEEYDATKDLLNHDLVKCAKISHQIVKFEFMPQLRDFCQDIKIMLKDKEHTFEGKFTQVIFDQCVKFGYVAAQSQPPFKMMVNSLSLPY